MRLSQHREPVAAVARRTRARGSCGRPHGCCRGRASCAGRHRPGAGRGAARPSTGSSDSPVSTCTGWLSATASSSSPSVKIAAREVLRGVEHARATGANQRVHHRPGDCLEAVREHGQAHAIDRLRRCAGPFPGALIASSPASLHGSTSTPPPPAPRATAPGGTTIVISLASIIAGPASSSPGDSDSSSQTGTSTGPREAKYVIRLAPDVSRPHRRGLLPALSPATAAGAAARR